MAEQVKRILCFGDSLTAGYSRGGTEYQPYRIVLASRLAAAFPKHKFEVWDNGVPGDSVEHGTFLKRIKEEASKGPIDWVIVLGGTNDLAGSATQVDSLFGALQEVWDVALNQDAKVLALTVPECAAKSKSLDTKRAALNAKIKGHEKDNFYAYDLHAAVPYHALRETERLLYWDDGLHLTCAGYDLMGEGIAIEVVRLLKAEGM